MIIDARNLPMLRMERDRLRAAYKAQKKLLDSLPAGRSKGLAGQRLSLIGKEGRLVGEEIKLIEQSCKDKGVLV